MIHSEQTTHVLLLQFELHIPHSHSLKEKRKVVRALKDKLKHHYNAGVSEIGSLDKWQRAHIAVVCTGNDPGYLDQQCQDILGFVESEILGQAQLISWEIEER